MFMNLYFYWSGVVANFIIVFWLAVGTVITLKSWREETKIKKKYARKNLGKSETNLKN